MKTQVLSFIVLALTLTGCGSDKSALKFTDGVKKVINEVQVKPVQPTDEKDLAFLSLQKNLVQTSCLKCHNATQTRHSNLTSKQVFTEKLDDIIYRVTGAFDVGDGFIPPKGERVKPEVIKELKAWRSDAQFANLQKSLFEPSCLKCHGPNQTRHSDLTSKAVVIEKYDNILYKMTKAFDESNKPMPPVGKGNRVSPELIKALEAWKANL